MDSKIANATLSITTVTLRNKAGQGIKTKVEMKVTSPSGVGIKFDCHPAAIMHEQRKLGLNFDIKFITRRSRSTQKAW